MGGATAYSMLFNLGQKGWMANRSSLSAARQSASRKAASRRSAEVRAGPAPVNPLHPEIEAEIGRHLRSMYRAVLEEPVPDRFRELLVDLEQKEGNKEG